MTEGASVADDSEAIWQAVEALRNRSDEHARAHADLRVEVSDLRGTANQVMQATQRIEAGLSTYITEAKEWRKGVDAKLEEVTENRGAMRVVVWVVGLFSAIGLMVAGWWHGGNP